MPNKQHPIQKFTAMCVISFLEFTELICDSSVLILALTFLKLCIEIHTSLKIMVSQKDEARNGASNIVDKDCEIETNKRMGARKQLDKSKKAKKIKRSAIDNGNCNKKSKGKQKKQR